MSAGTTPHRISGFRAWVIQHDDRWLFTFLYVGLAVFLSIWISLFWLVVVVAVHGLFEWLRQQHLAPDAPGVLGRVAWELKLDLVLVLFALSLAVYMDVILGVAGLGGAARLGATGVRVARASGWARAIRGVLLSLDDVAQVTRAAASRVGRGPAAADDAGADDDEVVELRPWAGRWSAGDHVAIWLGVLCVAALLSAPALLAEQTWSTLGRTLLGELHPWP
jgi:hypothetical protein